MDNIKFTADCFKTIFWFSLIFLFNFKVGASVDPAGVTMLDSIKIYGKTKEQFGWPEDPPEDFSSASVNNVCSPNLNQGNGTSDGDIATPTTTSGSVLERYGLSTWKFKVNTICWHSHSSIPCSSVNSTRDLMT